MAADQKSGVACGDEKQVDRSYSDLEVVETPGLEVAGSDASQVIPPLFQPRLDEAQRSLISEHDSPEVSYRHHHQDQQQLSGASYPYPPGVVPVKSPTTVSDYHYNGGKNPFQPPAEPSSDRRIWGLKRRMFWVLLAVVVLGIVVAIAVGLGVGLGIKSTNTASASASSTSSSAASTATSPSGTTSTATSTNTFPAAVATGTLTSDIGIVCPAANRTLYTNPSSTTVQKFLVLCGRDYNSAGGAVDLTSREISTFEGCLSECGNTDGCVAVGWGNYYGANTCWLKSTIGDSNESDSWYAAVRDDGG